MSSAGTFRLTLAPGWLGRQEDEFISEEHGWLVHSPDARMAHPIDLPGEMATLPQIFRFGEFEVDVRARQLRKKGAKIRLPGQPFQVLVMLLESPSQVITRQEIQQKLWPADTFVDFEQSLNTSIKKLRQALNDSATEPRYIETLPRIGYRFMFPVEVADEESAKQAPVRTDEFPPSSQDTPGTTNEAPIPRDSFAWFLRVSLCVVALAGVAVALNVAGTRDRFARIFRDEKDFTGAISAANKQRRSVAVLPLQNLTGDPAQDYFADGMTDELTTDLAQLGDLRVISRTSAMHYKGGNKTAPQIGRELGVDSLVEGSVQRDGNHVRIHAQLIDCATDRHLWAQTYDRDMNDPLSLQSEAAREIAGQIQGTVEPQPSSARSVKPEAYEAYLRGRYFWNKRTSDSLNKSIEYFEKAIAEDPSFAAAYAGLADSYSILGSDVLPADVANSKARAAATKAIELDPSIAEGHAALALVEFYYDWNWKQSEEEFRRAIELNPNYATAHQWYSYYLTAMARFSEAVDQAKEAQQIDPLSLSINTTLASKYRDAREYDKCIELDRKILEMDADFIPAHNSLAGVYEKQGSWQQAIEEYQKAAELSHDSPRALISLVYAYGHTGQTEEARKTLEELTQLSRQEYVSSFEMAGAYMGVGDTSNALTLLEKAYQKRESQMPFLARDSRFDPLHSDPRYQDLVRRLALPQ
jgi:TolB-like protein/DNA-binding winged helix-turn-helix (wHTH) protein/Tfp pilus assembly protein PilF